VTTVRRNKVCTEWGREMRSTGAERIFLGAEMLDIRVVLPLTEKCNGAKVHRRTGKERQLFTLQRAKRSHRGQQLGWGMGKGLLGRDRGSCWPRKETGFLKYHAKAGRAANWHRH
jgi:hypothetical protein